MAETHRQFFGNHKTLNLLFVLQLFIVGLVITGILPRAVVPFWTMILAIYVLWSSLEDSATFFVRSIPFFIAIPIINSFDSLNMWRVLSIIIFLKWLWLLKPKVMPKPSRTSLILIVLLLLAILSIIQAQSYVLAIKRIIYFVNLSLIGIVIHDLIGKNQDFSQRLIKNIAIPTMIVTIIGMVQLATTYFMDIFQFVDFWGGIVERNLFGNAWADTAIKANTWFAYFGDQLSLRMFSIFPDSHSFPIFLLLGLPAIFAIALEKVVQKENNGLKTMFKTRARLIVLFIPLAFLAAILTGTRGIWAAGLTSAMWAIFVMVCNRWKTDRWHQAVFKYASSYLMLFFLLFGVAYYIFASSQFMVEKNDSALLGKRIKSVLNISETSNARRIEIWKDSLRSIIKHPLLGVGIGNFPVVVGENLARAKAGSSAHNLYLHIAAELGLPALILTLWFLWLLIKKTYKNFLQAISYQLSAIYFASALLFIPWVLFYSLTDVAILDERTFLLLVVSLAVLLQNNHQTPVRSYTKQ